ncbi:MAG: phosphatase PAP2 family protein [Vicinamibacterales bacterium]
MRAWILAGFVFFLYVAAVCPLVRGLTRRRRAAAVLSAAVGLVLCGIAQAAATHPILRDWILPPVVLLVAYWSSGLLFAAPMSWAETALDAIDCRLRIDRIAASTPRCLAELLELGYLGVYPLIPIALAIHVTLIPDPNPDRFWTTVLIVDFICFGFLPWVQTRPPRALRIAEPWTAAVRRANVRLLGRTSIQVNTFPSGHAAEALAVVLLVADAPWPVVVGMGTTAILISAGAVLGRYHYAADAFAGWAVALAVWMS